MIFLLNLLGILVIILGITFIILLFIYTFSGAPYVPISDSRLKNLIKLSKAKKGEKIADLGSGDGRVVIAFAKLGIEAHGFEINPLLVYKSRKKIKQLKLEDKAFIHWKNFFNVNLAKFDLITVYGVTFIMGKLEKKLQRGLKKGGRIVSVYFKFPKLKAKEKLGDVYLYYV